VTQVSVSVIIDTSAVRSGLAVLRIDGVN